MNYPKTWCLLSCLALSDAAGATGRRLGYVMDNSNIYTARDAWLADSAAAEAAYGHISSWDTSGVTDMAYLFCANSGWSSLCNSAAASFNEDIGGWAVQSVTDMNAMFHKAYAFNQDLSGWAVHSVTSIYAMFHYASAGPRLVRGRRRGKAHRVQRHPVRVDVLRRPAECCRHLCADARACAREQRHDR